MAGAAAADKTLTVDALAKRLGAMVRAWLAPLVLLGVATTASARPPKPPPPPAAELVAVNTHETFLLRPDGKGRIGVKQLRGWNRFLRCHHTGRVHVMSARLAQLIYEVDKHFDFKRILVVAGYRAPRVAREKGNPKSPHKKGLACDFRIEGVTNTELRDFERTLPRVGVGYYPNSDFVHLDVRDKHSAFWIDYSGPGQRARYSRNPESDLADERAAVADEADSSGEGEGTPAESPPGMAPPGSPVPSTIGPVLGGVEPQPPTIKGAPAPNAPPSIGPAPRNP
jgi:uncharacterized protein YcbK (DUF882 family)